MSGQRRSTSGRHMRAAASHRAPRRRMARLLRVAVSGAATATGIGVGLVAFSVLGIGTLRHAPFHGSGTPPSPSVVADDHAVPPSTGGANSAVPGTTPSTPAPRALPLGRRTLSTITDHTTQVVIVRGGTSTSSLATVEFYERHEADWIRMATWKGHVGRRGWTTSHIEGDLKTPVGTFDLSDAGGRMTSPGTALPYYRSSAFLPPPTQPGFGDSTVDAFDYVIAVDYNRVRGRSPLDLTRPLGVERGGGIWLHVDHNGPTHGCVSIPLVGMRYLLQHLEPRSHPAIVMGDHVHVNQ
jgi:L,D-peptidoglycan transpeptidase YkuD (ErfK/YbiS/YcfS/YnhG family)